MRLAWAISIFALGSATVGALGLVFPWVTVASRVVVDRPLPAIWTLVSDAGRLPQWVCGLHSVEVLSGDPGRLGSVYALTVDASRESSNLQATIVLADPPRRYVFEAKTGWGRTLTDVRFTHGARGVEITVDSAVAADDPLAKSLLVLMRRSMQARQDASLERLRALIENVLPPYSGPLAHSPSRAATASDCG